MGRDGIKRVLRAAPVYVAAVSAIVAGQPAWADWTHLISGYPNMWIGGLSPVIADLDGDGGAKQIVILTQGNPSSDDSALVILEWDGEERAFVELPYWCDARSLGSVADLDRDGTLEIVAQCNGSAGQRLMVFDHNGGIETDIEIELYLADELYGCIVIADLDGDSELELVYTGWDTSGTRIAVMDASGVYRAGFPVMLEATQTSEGNVPAVGDLDGDGPLDVAVTSYRRDPDGAGGYTWTAHIAAYSGDGVELWCHEYPWRCCADPVIGDVDDDGLNEVVVTSDRGLHIIDDDGSMLYLPLGVDKVHSNVALADFDGDDDLEIVFGYATILHAVHHDGSEVFTFEPDWLPHHPPVIGDADGDGALDVLFNSDDEVYGLDAAGNLLPGFPLPLLQIIAYNAPAIDDIDGDGLVELVSCSNWGAVGEVDYGIVHLWDLNAASEPLTMPWPTFQHDPAHTGCGESQLLFADGFESGGTSAWSLTVGGS
jgi:hypothetical protein